MVRRVFLDVGGHLAETLAVAVHPRWGFDRIWTFEPSSRCLDALNAVIDDRVAVVDAGWWSSDTEMDLHDPGTLGGSVGAARVRVGDVERCRFIDAAEWLNRHIEPGDEVWAKVNIEGAEVEVLRHLLQTGTIGLIDHLVVRFDVEKVPNERWRADELRAELRAAGVAFVEGRDVMFGRDVGARTSCWLQWTERAGPRDRLAFERRKIEHRARKLVYRGRRWIRGPAKRTINRGKGASSGR